MPLDRIVIATGNPHKVRELRAILEKLGIDALALAALGAYDEPPETGATFEANASIKALYYARQTGMVCLADDSGLEVDALGGTPGVISSHWCTDGREAGMSRDERDRLNNERLLRELDGVAPEGRTARFVCVMALAAPNHTPGGAGFSSTSGAGFHPAGDPLPTPDRCDAGPRPLSPEQRRMREVNRAPYGKLGKRRRRLPHWLRDGGSYFVTFRLREGQLSSAERQCVLDACFHWHGIRSLVHLAVIMPDHVHLLVTPLPRDAGGWYSLADTIGSAKRHSAFEINRLRGAAGALWMDESFDRLLRPGEFEQKWDYIADNPVRAGLVARSSDYAFLVEGDGRIAERGRAAGRMESCPTPRGEMGAMEVIATTRGTFEGRIGMPGEVPRGEGGFGYDPMFLVAPEYALTSAELPPDEKNARSHRAMAARLMAERIAALREA